MAMMMTVVMMITVLQMKMKMAETMDIKLFKPFVVLAINQ